MTLEDLKSYLSILTNQPQAQALVVIILAMALAKLTDLLVSRGLKKATSRTRTDLDDQIINLLHRPVFWTVVLIGLVIAVELSVPEEWEWIGFGALSTLLTLIWLLFFIRLATVVVHSMSLSERRFQFLQPATEPLFDIGAKVAFMALAGYLVLLAWDFDVSGLLASAGILGLALGLAAKDTLANLFAGVSILADAPYKIGDYIVLDNSERGRVTKIGLRSTRILTRDDIEVTVPNSVISQTKIINESGGPSPQQRLRLPVGVAYGTDADLATRVILEVARNQASVSKEPAPWVQFKGFGASSLDFELRCWIDVPEMRGRTIDALNREIYRGLGKAGIEIPYPKRDVYIKELPKNLLHPSREGI